MRKARERRNDQSHCSNRRDTDGKLSGPVVLAAVGMAEHGHHNDKQQGGKGEVSQEHGVSLRSGDPAFAAARILKSWNGWKKGTTANMQVNDQADDVGK